MSMITSSGAAQLPEWRGHREVLDAGECVQLLGDHQIGRLAYSTESGPRIVPMNYALAGDTLLFRTGYDTEAAQYVHGAVVAFEVDEIDEFLQTAWSVVVLARANPVSPAALRLLDLPQVPQPWATGDRSMMLQLALSDISGRRIHAA